MTQAIGVPQRLPAVLPVETMRGAAAAEPARADVGAGQAKPAIRPTADQEAALRQLSESLRDTPVDLQYSVGHDTNQVIVKLVGRDSREVIRQIPSEEMLRIAKAIDKLQGLLVHQTA